MKPKIGVDLMGGGTAPNLLLQSILHEDLDVDLVFFVSSEFSETSAYMVVCPEFIEMDENPVTAVRQKRASTLAMGLQYLKEKKIDAFVSCGHTGALLLSAKRTLPLLPRIERPALLTLLPTHGRDMAVLDVGANLSLKPAHLLQLAAMGIAYQKSRGVDHPVVGLLNVGREALKGTAQMRDAYQKLETLNDNRRVFIGNIEGREAFLGEIDVIVCDGLTGNIFLKTAEGIANFVLTELEHLAGEEEFTPFKKVLSRLRHRFHYDAYPGALLCGVEGIVIKCHGDASPAALINGIKGACHLVKHRFLHAIKNQLIDLLP